MPKFTVVYWFEYVDSGLGVYTRAWFPSKRSAERERRRMIRESGFTPPGPDEHLTGEDHQIGEVYADKIRLTPRGVLQALRNSDPNPNF